MQTKGRNFLIVERLHIVDEGHWRLSYLQNIKHFLLVISIFTNTLFGQEDPVEVSGHARFG